MNNRLDQRIRRLVVEIVDLAPPPPAFDTLPVPATLYRPAQRLVVVAFAALTVLALAFAAAWFIRDESSAPNQLRAPRVGELVRLPMRTIPLGVSARVLRETPVFLVRDGDSIGIFSARWPRREGSASVWWCRDEHVFGIQGQRVVFDRSGRPISKRIDQGLARYATVVRDRTLEIDLNQASVPRGESHRPKPKGVDDWYPGSGSFCQHPLASGGYREPTEPATRHLVIRALPTVKYQANEFTVQAGVVQMILESLGGTHTLVFEESELDGFQLGQPGGQSIGDVQLEPGAYTVYCTIPGHRAAGEEATIVVTP